VMDASHKVPSVVPLENFLHEARAHPLSN